MKTVVVLGTSRDDSYTLQAVKDHCPFNNYDLVDLRKLNIGYYSYNHNINGADDFTEIAVNMVAADNIIFATPVYWYAMSGVLKVFFDRLSELLSTHKPLGKALKGKTTYLIATGADAALPPGFEVPFKLTSEYFEMSYAGAFYSMTR